MLDSDPQVDETVLAAAELAKALASATGKVAPPPAPPVDEEPRILEAREECTPPIDVELFPWKCFLSSTKDEEKTALGCQKRERFE
jgi:hypothetical protein